VYELKVVGWPDLSEDFGPRLDRADKWSNHLAHKVEEGDDYHRTEDPWYTKKFEEWLSVHDPHRQNRVDLRIAQFDDEWAVMSEAEREEYHSEASSFDEAEEEMSTDGEDSKWGDDEHISD
jgi:hypothetical protein